MSGAEFDADLVVIGSGVAGALVARETAAAGLKVVILEAGERWDRGEALNRYHKAWNRTITAPYKQPEWALTTADEEYFGGKGNKDYQPSFLKGVGGTTWHWTGITPRFLPADFELHKRYGVGEDWPISYADLEPWYVKAEAALGVSGDSKDDHGSPRSAPYPNPPIPMTYGDKLIGKKLAVAGVKVASLPAARNSRSYDGRPACAGNSMCTPLCPIGAAYSGDVDVDKAVAAGARLISKAVAFDFELDESNQIAAVRYKHPDGSEHALRARRFVVACNSIETPRLLLMAGGKKHRKGLANSSGQVGRNLMDHTIFVSKFTMPEPLYIGRGPQSVSTLLTGRDGGFRKKHAAAKFFLGNDLNIHVEAANLLQNDANWVDPLTRLRDIAIHQGQIGAEIEQLPESGNRMRLDRRRLDPLGLPLPRIDYSLSRYTKRGVRQWQKYAHDLVKKMGGRLGESISLLSSHHPCGTARMGVDPKHSVVNADCQSHDHANLYIAGSAAFPAMGTANPTLTIAALSLRLADHLLKDKA